MAVGSSAKKHRWLAPQAAATTDNQVTPVGYTETAVDPHKDPFGDVQKNLALNSTKPGESAPPAETGVPDERSLQFPASPKPAAAVPTPAPTTAAKPAAPRTAVQPALQKGQARRPSDLDLSGPNAPIELKTKCPTAEDLKPIDKILLNIQPDADAVVKGSLPNECTIGHRPFVPRNWEATNFAWTAASLCNKPLYFQQVQVERYGHTWGPILQPVLSAGTFFVEIPLLPYSMGLYPPNECMYALGYYRPGSCAPYMIDPFPLSVRGALVEAGAVAGAVAILP